MTELSKNHTACKSQNNLCPACRLFGFVGGKKSADENNAGGKFAGRITVTDAIHQMPENQTVENVIKRNVLLKELSSPKPSFLPFYSVDGKSFDDQGASIRGRKFYWHNPLVNQKSDIYSLGITMFEMITGRVPFDGDTTVSIAIAHIQEELPSPKIYAEDIPVSLEQIIEKCCQKRPDRRYQTMAELVSDLKRALLDPDGNFVKIIPAERKEEKTQIVSEEQRRDIRSQTGGIATELIAATAAELEESEDIDSTARIMVADDLISGNRRPVKKHPRPMEEDEIEEEEFRTKRPKKHRDEGEEEVRKKRPKSSEGRKRPAPENGAGNRKKRPANKKPARRKQRFEEYDYMDEETDSSMEKVMSVLGIIAAIIIVIIAIFVVTKVFDIFKSTTASVAQKDGSTEMIDVVGMGFDEAKSSLRSLGLDVQATYESSSNVEKNVVMEQDIAAGTKIPEGTKVELTVSSGTDGVYVPDVTGVSEAEAKVSLENAGFKVEKDYSSSDSVEKGNVISQNPDAGAEAAEGATITIVISQGKSETEVSVPDIRLQTKEDAEKMLIDAGLSVGAVSNEASVTVPIGCVVTQSYSPNVTVPSGTEVSFTVNGGAEEGALLKCNLAVTAPGGYMGGNADVVLTQNDTGTVLFATTTTAFPVAINLSNITGSPACTLAIRYDVATTNVIQAEDGTPTPVVTTESKTDTQQIALMAQ